MFVRVFSDPTAQRTFLILERTMKKFEVPIAAAEKMAENEKISIQRGAQLRKVRDMQEWLQAGGDPIAVLHGILQVQERLILNDLL